MKLKTLFRGLLAAFVATSGVLHFLKPELFAAIVPDYLPYPFALVYISGFFEILGGVGLLLPKTRRMAAWGLIALFIAVFPANVHMAIHNLPINGNYYPMGAWLRLPFQGVFIAWAYWLSLPDTHI